MATKSNSQGNGQGKAQAAHDLRLQAEKLDRLLPQTQCGQCGYAGCLPYAQALAAGSDEVSKCKPGGRATAFTLAGELGLSAPEWQANDKQVQAQVQVAVIDEERCVGCYKCIEACPVDAVIGAHGVLHTVFADYCTGCGLCVAPCPVDCIDLVVAQGATGDGQLVQHGVVDDRDAQQAASRLRDRYLAKRRRPPLRGAVGKSDFSPADMARKAMSRAKRRKGV